MTPELSEDTKLVAVEDQLTSEVDAEKVVLQTETGTYYGIEGVGGRAWELLQQPCSVEELRAKIAAEYDVDPERCHRDVDEFLSALLDEQLVERVDDVDG